MCSRNPFKFRWWREHIRNLSSYHHEIGSINFSNCCHIFPKLRVLGGCGFMSITTVQSMMCTNNSVYHGLNVEFVTTLPHYHRYVDLSKIIEHIKYFPGIFNCIFWVESIFSIVFYAIYGAVFSTYLFLFYAYENICTFSYYRLQIVNINHSSLFMVTPWHNDMRCMYCYVHIALIASTHWPLGDLNVVLKM